MAVDLSNEVFPDGPVAALVPTSQHANTTSSNAAAFAPPPTSSPGADPAPGPYAQAADHERTTTGDGQDGTPASGPPTWTRAGG